VSRNGGVVNSDSSSRSNNVVNNSSGNTRERVSVEIDVIVSNDVDNPVSLQVAVISGIVSERVHFTGSESQIVDSFVGIVARNEKSRPVDRLVDVISVSGQSFLESSVASLSSIEVGIKASFRVARSSSSSVP